MAESDPKPVRLVIDNAAALSPAPSAAEAGGDDERIGRPGTGLPAECPVTPLGLSDDGQYYYLDAIRQLRILKERDHSRLGVLSLFNRRWQVLQEYWPRLSKDGTPTGWRPERAAEELIAACGRKGPLDIANRVRGPAAGLGRDGQLVLHCGDRVLFGNEWRRPGELEGYVYPAAAPVPPPSEIIALGGTRGPAAELLRILKTWHWQRPETDPYLLLGWIGAAKIGGALPWRPTMWLTGDLAAGKSTLLGLIAMACGQGGIHAVTDTTPAGIWQTTRHSSLPVTLDEAEAESDPRRMSAIIKLARTASSGGVTYRGGSEHHPITFTIRCCFLFSSILIPGLLPQDWSRISVLELGPLAAGSSPPVMDPKKMRALGEALTRRLVDHWPRLIPAFERYRYAFMQTGHTGRGADQNAILLACAELLLQDHADIPSDELELWTERLKPSETAGYSDEKRDHQRCLDRILSTIIDPYRNGGRRSIAQWVRDAIEPSDGQPRSANEVLETYGLAVVIERPGGSAPLRWLYIANTHSGLAQIFAGSHWAAGSGTSAPWVQALRRVPGACRVNFHRFAGFGCRATRIPLDDLLAEPCEVRDD
jgi:hypothetical protein